MASIDATHEKKREDFINRVQKIAQEAEEKKEDEFDFSSDSSTSTSETLSTISDEEEYILKEMEEFCRERTKGSTTLPITVTRETETETETETKTTTIASQLPILTSEMFRSPVKTTKRTLEKTITITTSSTNPVLPTFQSPFQINHQPSILKEGNQQSPKHSPQASPSKKRSIEIQNSPIKLSHELPMAKISPIKLSRESLSDLHESSPLKSFVTSSASMKKRHRKMCF